MFLKITTTRHFRQRNVFLGIAVVLLVLAVSLGLGLGLTLGRDNGEDASEESPTTTISPLPSPNITLPWMPHVNATWQIILSHPPTISSEDTFTIPDVDIFDIDLFDTPVETIKRLHDLGKKVICYFSAGSYEMWRPDASEFEAADLGKELDGWPGEKWLKLSSKNVQRIMKNRLEMAKQKGCDGVDPDNVDGYQNDNGLFLNQQDSISYISYLSSITVPLNLILGLKNAGTIIPAVLGVVHFSVNEQCVKYSECNTFQSFINAGKPVFHIEYPDGAGEGSIVTAGLSGDVVKRFCAEEGDSKSSQGFSTVLKKMDLDGWVEYCDRSVNTSAVDETVGELGRSRQR